MSRSVGPVVADGMERLRRWREQDRGVPPAVGRLGARLDGVERDTTRVGLPLTAELLRPDGTTTGAVTSLLADIGLTTSVVSSLPDLSGVTTISLTVDHLRLPPVGGSLLATCTAAAFSGGGPQHAAGVVVDDDGREVARASGWFLPTPADSLSVDRVGLVDERPAAHLLDLLRVPAGASFELVARDALSNALGSLHGGVGALASQLAAETALGARARPLTSSFSYLRPTPRDGSVTVTGSVVRQGRRTGTASATVVGPDGRVVLQAWLVAALAS